MEEERKAPRGERERECVFGGGVDKTAVVVGGSGERGGETCRGGELRKGGRAAGVGGGPAALLVELLGRLGFRAPPSGRLRGVKVAPFPQPLSRHHLPC